MILIAIDPGYEKVGYAIFQKNTVKKKDFTFLGSDLIKTSAKDTHEKRLFSVYTSLSKIIQTNKVESMVIEQLFFFKNKKTVLQVAQAIGVIELIAAQNKLPITRLTPLQIKETITGYGVADKKSVQKMIKLELGDAIHFKEDDESDAIACGLAYCLRNDSDKGLLS